MRGRERRWVKGEDHDRRNKKTDNNKSYGDNISNYRSNNNNNNDNNNK